MKEGAVMKEGAAYVEYGQVIDPNYIIAPPDPDFLELEADHPGINDAAYIARRNDLFALCRKHRLENLGPPIIEYNAEENRIWREVAKKLGELHVKYACSLYNKGKADLAIDENTIPQLRTVSDRTVQASGMHLVPAEGALHYRIFYNYIAPRGFPVTQFIRHGSKPEFTPEPDMIHDCLGHVPPIMDRKYADILHLIGRAAATTQSGEHLLALKRFSWFSIEFGLIEEHNETKVFGAGILSSTGEIPNSLFSKDVTRRPFVTEDVINQDYDPSQMQVNLFIAPSLEFLETELVKLVRRLNIPVL